ncbi:MAG: bifunctional DNA-formamidopyrimidine glycosylase/DNA-(apurinic or apyrimidinic site) lyase [Acidobacteriia bacterium]|nr:bifunctional DNA-formamidopyrimidine glycosylase/DNA-(apurinic or apyrimidinic site) lyase [Terriglobia bacterium]
MPELPEVETVARGLRAALPGRRIVRVRLGKTDFIDNPGAMEQQLPGSRIQGVRRHGKFLVVDLESRGERSQDSSLLIHLGMTGQLVVSAPEAPVAPHTHVFLALDDGREVRYTDARRFGSMRMVSTGEREAALGELGLDALEATQDEFMQQLRGRRARIKALLLDQRVLRGMGNIYTDESLWRARIHPMRLGATLQGEELRRLHRAVRKVLTQAIEMRGSSISDYVDAEGQPGGFQRRHRVYQREGKKCVRCGTAIQRVIVAGRSSYFCRRCQPAPRGRRRSKKGATSSAPTNRTPRSIAPR